MPANVGTLMVVIRAQDFASRTLRRVSSEFAGMSRAQMIAARQAQLTADKLRALEKVTDARRNLRNVRMIQAHSDAMAERQRITKKLARAQLTLRDAKMRQMIANSVQATKDATSAQKRYNQALSERQRMGRLVDVVGGKGAAQALNRLAQAQARLGTGGAAAAREFRNAQKAVDGLGRGLRRNSQLMRQFEQAAARTASAWKDLRRARDREARAPSVRRIPGVVARVQPPAAEFARLKTAQRAVSQLQGQLKQLDGRLGRLGQAINAMPSRFQRLSMAVSGTRNATATMGEAMTKAQRSLRDAHAGLDKATKAQMRFNDAMAQMPLQKVDRFAHALSGVGRTMQLFGAVGTVAFGLAANSFADFNTQVTLAATQTRKVGQTAAATAANADRLTKVIMGLMQEFPASSQEMADAAYTIFSSIDVGFGQGTKLLREFNKVAVAGGVDLQTATNASITVLENFDRQLAETGQTSAKTGQLLNRMFSIVRFGRLNFLQLSQMLGMVVPAATGAGQSFDDVAGALAFLTRTLGMKAGPSLARFLEVIVNPDVQKGMKRAGVSITDLTGALLPLPEIIDRMAAVAGHSKANLNDFLRVISAYGRATGRGREWTVQARRALIQLIKGNREYHTVQAQTIGNNDEFAKSFEAMSQTLGVRWKVFLNQLKVLVLFIGEKAIPVFLRIGDTIQGWIQRWQNLSEATRGSIVKWAVIISVGTLIAGVIASIAGALLSLGVMLALAGPKLISFGKTLFTISGAVKSLAAIGAIKIGFELFKKGGNWNLLGGLLTGGALASLLRKGARGTFIGATIGLAATLIFKGNGWQSQLGQILMGAATGFAFGGPAGAAAGALLASFTVIIQAQMEQKEAVKALRQMQASAMEAAKTMSAAMNIPLEDAVEQIKIMMKAGMGVVGKQTFDFKDLYSEAGLAAAIAFLTAWTAEMKKPGGPRDAFDGLARDAAAAMKKPAGATETFNQKMTRLMKTAKDYTVIQAAVEAGNQQITNSAEKMAIQIGMAFSRGNIANAARFLNAYTRASTVKLTAKNILKMISDAVKAGDLQKATQLLEDWARAVEQGREDMEQYRDDMKQYAKDLAQASKDAATSMIDNFRQMYDTLLQKNEELFGQIAQGPFLGGETFDIAKEWGMTFRVEDVTRDLKMQTEAFRKHNRTIAALVKKGVPRQMIEGLRESMGEQADPFFEQLLGADPAKRAALIKAWKAGQQVVKDQTKFDFKDEINRFKKAGIAMGENIVAGFESAKVDEWFGNWIRTTFPAAIDAAVAEARRKFKEGQPPPVRPTVPGTPAGTNKPAGATAANRGGVGTLPPGQQRMTQPPPPGRTINIYQTFHGPITAADEAALRRMGFVAKNTLKGQK